MLLEYYVTEEGNVPVREWLLGLPAKHQGLALRYLEQLSRLGLDARKPLVVPVGPSHYVPEEVRAIERLHNYPLYVLSWPADGKGYHIMYSYVSRSPKFMLLHGYLSTNATTVPIFLG